MNATVHTPFYDWDGRKYLEFEIQNKIVRVKVPWRYSRVMCRIEGFRTLQELQKGDKVQIQIQKKVWDGIEYSVLKYIKTE
jgi:hypothetical protein